MSDKPGPSQKNGPDNSLRSQALRFWRFLSYRWGWKLGCLLLAMILWGGIISQDSSLTREKRFSDVTVSVINSDVLIRSGLIVVSGIDDFQPIRMNVAVPQKIYATAIPSNYNPRVDLSRISATGTQTVPILYSNSSAYGTVTWLSVTEITVDVEEYVTKRRIPVQLEVKNAAPAGFYAAPPSVDPALVTVSGPKSLCENLSRCVAAHDLAGLAPQAGTQFSAVPFTLYSGEGKAIRSDLLAVTFESVQLDTLLVEQALYPMKTVDINLSGILSGTPAEGYRVVSVTADPSYLSVAGSNETVKSLKLLDIDASINVEGARETLIRSVKVQAPPGAQYLSEGIVYVTVVIEAAADGSGEAG